LGISLLFLPTLPVLYWLVHTIVKARFSSIRHLLGPDTAHWLWGHELIAYESPYEEAYTKWMDTYGPTYKLKGALFQPDIIVTADHEAIAWIYGKGVYSYVKSPIIRPLLERLMGRGLVWAEGSTHKRQRQQLSPFFTTQAIRDTFDTINTSAHRGVENLEIHINEHADNSKKGLVLDISEWTSSITLDIIGRFAFNYDFESGKSRAAQVIKHSWREQIKTGLH
ncbi:unnamed protein product, partial [Rhizoctonia solani]